ncbi:MAG: hypothetical protein Q7R76_07225 [Candidatus Woesearchaeota archaeon]|nr:hypothetical protein [Candidatus Woesearchaeota archaeon]
MNSVVTNAFVQWTHSGKDASEAYAEKLAAMNVSEKTKFDNR